MKEIYYDTIKEASIKLSYSLPYRTEGDRMDFAEELNIKLIEMMKGFALEEKAE